MRAWVVLATSGVFYALVVTWAATQLPSDGVPLQFGTSGRINRVGTRGEALTPSIVLAVVMLGLGVGLVLLARYGPLRALNIPNKSYWLAADRAPEVRRMLADDMALTIGGTLVFLALIPVWAVLGARGGDDALPDVVVVVPIGAFIVGLLAWCVWLGRYRYRPRPDR
jgi:hypothetical protein